MENNLLKLHETQVEILEVIHNICEENNIHYSLYAGTLLGAVRHGGFIPWDDDLDICMLREDYNRFLQVWDNNPPSGYFLQNKLNSPSFSQTFTKIRKNHTTFLQKEEPVGQYHTGVFVDVFPLDRMPAGKLKRLLFKHNAIHYLLLTREYVPQNSSILIRWLTKVLLKINAPSRRPEIRSRLLKRITQYSNNNSLQIVATEILGTINTVYPSEMFDEFVQIMFEGKKFWCTKNWDLHLRIKYGDYMKLPPEEERIWKHHPVLLDFEHSYEELINGSN